MEANRNHAAATVYLDKLAEELTNRGLQAWIMAPPGRVPSVYITNPAARALEESVYADRGKDGLWWFWWSWAERISIADDLDAAATAITRVLGRSARRRPRGRRHPGVPGPGRGNRSGASILRRAGDAAAREPGRRLARDHDRVPGTADGIR